MIKVILDTNFLMIPTQFNIDVFSEVDSLVFEKHKLLVLDKSIKELERIVEEQKGKNKLAAKLALQLLDCKCGIIETDSGNYVDDLIVELADEETIVCTQDIKLRKRVKEKGSKVIGMKQKNYLDFM